MKVFYPILLLSFLGVSSVSYGLQEVKNFASGKISGLQLRNDCGKITVIGKEGVPASVASEKIRWGEECELNVEQVGAKIAVMVRKKKTNPKFLMQNACEVNFSITLPSHAEVEIDNGAGAIAISGVAGKFKTTQGSGNLSFDKTVIENLHADIGSGEVTIDGEVVEATIKTGTGNVEVNYPKIPSTGYLTTEIGSGNVLLHLPKDATVKILFSSGSGTLSSEVASDAKANYAISMESGSGNLKIKRQ